MGGSAFIAMPGQFLNRIERRCKVKITINWDNVINVKEIDGCYDYLHDHGGVYLWIFQGSPRRVSYIGEAKQFYSRYISHIANFVSGLNVCFNAGADDDLVKFLGDVYDGKKSIFDVVGEQPPKVYYPPVWVPYAYGTGGIVRDTFFNKDALEISRRFLDNTKFAFGTFDSGNGVSTKDVESALIVGLRNHYKKIAGSELRLSTTSNGGKRGISKDVPIGHVSRYPKFDFDIEHNVCDKKISDELPPEILNISSYRR